jgi:hypothetical protein
MNDEQNVKRYRCFMSSKPGMYAQYDGHVDVWSPNDDWEEVFSRATAELKRTAFPERSSSMWRMDDFQLLRTA